MRYFIFTVHHERHTNKQIMLFITSEDYPSSKTIAESASAVLFPDSNIKIQTGWILQQSQEIAKEDFEILQKPLK